jgi:type VI secretion system secreted protein VgrG
MPHFDLTLSGGIALETHTFSVREGISQLFSCEIVAMSHDAAVDLEAIVGQPAQLVALSGTTHLAGWHRSWRGVVSGMDQLRVETLSEKGQSTYALAIVPTLWLLTQRQGYRIFQHLSVPEIVDALLAEWNVEHAWNLTGTYEKLEYKVQYGESDYAFLCRLVEEPGIAFTFPDHAPVDAGALSPGFVDAGGAGWSGGSLLTFGDDLSSGTLYVGSPVDFVHEPNASAQREFVTDVQLSHGVRPGAVTIRDHDFRNPGFPLMGKAAPAPESFYEQYAYQPGAFLVEGAPGGDTPVADDKDVARHLEPIGTALATRRLVALRQGRRQVSFSSNVLGLEPAMLLTMGRRRPAADLRDPRLRRGRGRHGPRSRPRSRTRSSSAAASCDAPCSAAVTCARRSRCPARRKPSPSTSPKPSPNVCPCSASSRRGSSSRPTSPPIPGTTTPSPFAYTPWRAPRRLPTAGETGRTALACRARP